jgi:hypothetical protein
MGTMYSTHGHAVGERATILEVEAPRRCLGFIVSIWACAQWRP